MNGQAEGSRSGGGFGGWPARLKLSSAQVRSEGRVWLRYEVLGEKENPE